MFLCLFVCSFVAGSLGAGLDGWTGSLAFSLFVCLLVGVIVGLFEDSGAVHALFLLLFLWLGSCLLFLFITCVSLENSRPLCSFMTLSFHLLSSSFHPRTARDAAAGAPAAAARAAAAAPSNGAAAVWAPAARKPARQAALQAAPSRSFDPAETAPSGGLVAGAPAISKGGQATQD